jgi:ferredoxin
VFLRVLVGFRVMFVHGGSPVSVDGVGNPLAPPISLGHVYDSIIAERFFRAHISDRVMSERITSESIMAEPTSDVATERTIEGLRIHIDRTLCVSFGDCVDAAPNVFELDDEDIAVFVTDAGSISREELIEACACCPVDALEAFDEKGEQLAP